MTSSETCLRNGCSFSPINIIGKKVYTCLRHRTYHVCYKDDLCYSSCILTREEGKVICRYTNEHVPFHLNKKNILFDIAKEEHCHKLCSFTPYNFRQGIVDNIEDVTGCRVNKIQESCITRCWHLFQQMFGDNAKNTSKQLELLAVRAYRFFQVHITEISIKDQNKTLEYLKKNRLITEEGHIVAKQVSAIITYDQTYTEFNMGPLESVEKYVVKREQKFCKET